VLFGRGRLGGNYLNIGRFFRIKDNLEGTPGRRIYVMHAVLGLCEGPLPTHTKIRRDDSGNPIGTQTVPNVGNIRQDQKKTTELATQEEQSVSRYSIDAVAGTLFETVATNLTTLIEVDPRPNYDPIETPIPYRRTAKLSIETLIESPRLANFNCDAEGPTYGIFRGTTTSGSNFLETGIFANYDAYTGAFYYTVSAGTGIGPPFGLSRNARDGAFGHTHQLPPNSVSNDIEKAWYLGRHDVLVMQDPDDGSLFHVGYWGIDRGSADWEHSRPDQGYEHPINGHHLDELHGILHTVHDDGTTRYVMRWNLLTGRIVRQDIDLPSGGFRAFIYSPDLHAYVAAMATTLYLVSAEDGTTFHSTTAVTLTNCKGLCVAGSRIGIISNNGFVYYDPNTSTASVTLGTTTTNLFTEGAMGGVVWATQNTFTGHVTLLKNNITSTVGFVNFFASVVEDLEDVSANGTPAEAEFQWGEDPGPTQDRSGGWVRDWSWKGYNTYHSKFLQGNSSLAGAIFGLLVDEKTFDPTLQTENARWGAGLPIDLVSLSSIESIHGYCVGGVIMQNPDRSGSSAGSGSTPSYRYAERYKFDFVLDGETGVADLLSSEMLAACNGYRYQLGGKLYVGIAKPGAFACWHFNDELISDVSVSFTGRVGINKVRVQFTDVRDEYRKNFAEWGDEYDQNRRSRVQAETITLNGVGRNGHAEIIAKQIGDTLSASRRQITFKTFFVALAIVPGDVIEVSHIGSGLSRVKARVSSIKEDENGRIEISCIEHKPVLEVVRDAPPDSVPPPGPGDNGGTEPGDCERAQGSTGTGVIYFNGSATYGPGNYTVKYITGAYRMSLDGEYAVEGYDVVYKDIDGSIIVILAAPAVANPGGGFATALAAENANRGQADAFQFDSTAPIGIRLRTAPQFSNDKPEGNPIYELCLEGGGSSTGGASGSGSGSGSSSSGSSSGSGSGSGSGSNGCDCDDPEVTCECQIAPGCCKNGGTTTVTIVWTRDADADEHDASPCPYGESLTKVVTFPTCDLTGSLDEPPMHAAASISDFGGPGPWGSAGLNSDETGCGLVVTGQLSCSGGTIGPLHVICCGGGTIQATYVID
jgi:uncharacterized membrane protein YgcG